MIQTNFYNITVKVRDYVMGNWGSPFIVGFMLLLLTAAVSLSAGLSSLANTVAAYAYYVLFAGVVLQLASFFNNRKKKGETD